MSTIVVIIAFILSIIVTRFILKIINRNTFGTQKTYVVRAITVWFISFIIIAGLLGNLV